MGSHPLSTKIRMLAEARKSGRGSRAGLMPGPRWNWKSRASVVCVTLGDQNLTKEEVLVEFSQTLVDFSFFFAACKGVIDKQGKLHQDLIAVDRDPGVEFAHIYCDVVGFDHAHQAVQVQLCRKPTGPELAPPAIVVPAVGNEMSVPPLESHLKRSSREEHSRGLKLLRAQAEKTGTACHGAREESCAVASSRGSTPVPPSQPPVREH